MPALAAVQEQYETLPYPPRDPARERQRLLMPGTARLPLARHLLWAGGRAAPKGSRQEARASGIVPGSTTVTRPGAPGSSR